LTAVTERALADVASLAELRQKGRLIVKVGRKQIVLFHGDKGVFACNNRCPHEGYPLAEGSLADGCILTCNWHNWKFDLEKGDTLVGGDKLRLYPVTVEGDRILLDVTDPPAGERIDAALDSLRASFRRYEYDRMARELARLEAAGGALPQAVAAAIDWTHDRLEFGMTHAHAATADWLALADTAASTDPMRIAASLECVGHLAWDTLREPPYPYPTERVPYAEDGLVAAIEAEDEARAIGMVRDALARGLDYAALQAPLARAALAHYAGFGHPSIYVLKTGELIDRLGSGVAEPLLLALVRYLIYASREDLIPEFRHYTKALAAFGAPGGEPVAAADFAGLNVNRALDRVVSSGTDTGALYEALLEASAAAMLHFDMARQERTDIPVSQNVGWLDFTHMITFANAARQHCERNPSLWPAALLQMACFLGRVVGDVDHDRDMSAWKVEDPVHFFAEAREALFDHGQFDYITSCHRLKVLMATADEIANRPDAPWTGPLLAAVNRYLNSDLKRKHVARTAHQALSFVAAEG